MAHHTNEGVAKIPPMIRQKALVTVPTGLYWDTADHGSRFNGCGKVMNGAAISQLDKYSKD